MSYGPGGIERVSVTNETKNAAAVQDGPENGRSDRKTRTHARGGSGKKVSRARRERPEKRGSPKRLPRPCASFKKDDRGRANTTRRSGLVLHK